MAKDSLRRSRRTIKKKSNPSCSDIRDYFSRSSVTTSTASVISSQGTSKGSYYPPKSAPAQRYLETPPLTQLQSTYVGVPPVNALSHSALMPSLQAFSLAQSSVPFATLPVHQSQQLSTPTRTKLLSPTLQYKPQVSLWEPDTADSVDDVETLPDPGTSVDYSLQDDGAVYYTRSATATEKVQQWSADVRDVSSQEYNRAGYQESSSRNSQDVSLGIGYASDQNVIQAQDHKATSSFQDYSSSDELHILSTDDNSSTGNTESARVQSINKAYKIKEKARKKAARLRRRERNEEESKIEEEVDVARAADRLVPLFLKSWDGCGKDEHNIKLQDHLLTKRDDHNLLDVTYEPHKLQPGYRNIVGISQPGFPRQTGLSRDNFNNSNTMRKTYEGSVKDQAPPTVCLHLEHDLVGKHVPHSSKDTDSVLLFATSLAVLRKEFMMCAVYDPTRNIQASLHQKLNVNVYDEEGKLISASLEFKDIPHTTLGYMNGITNLVYLGFPRLYSRKNQATNHLTKIQEARLYDCVVRPAIQTYTLPGNVVYIPRTQEMADVDAYAKAGEMRTNYSNKKMMSHFPIHPDRNGDVWNRMMDIINSDDKLCHFRDPVLFVDVKNIKGQTADLNLYESMDKMDDRLEDLFDQAFVPDDMNLRDLGCIAAPDSPEVHVSRGGYTFPAITYQWRRCCLESMIEGFRTDGFDDHSFSSRLFTVGYLWEIACLGLEPPNKCYLSSGGLRYLQCYGCGKAVLDAMGVYPYQGDNICDICVGPVAFTAAASKTNSTHARDYDAGFRQAGNSKDRITRSLTCDVLTSQGIRLEIRITMKLWRAIKRRARQHYDNEMSQELAPCTQPPEAAFAVFTSRWLSYLLGNFDKWISLLEICSLTTEKMGQTLDQSRFMRVLIECIQQLLNSHVQEFPALWVSKKVSKDGTERIYGLGFGDTFRDYNYAWVTRRVIDWETLRFRSKITGHLAGHIDRRLLSWFPEASTLIVQHIGGRQLCMHYLSRAKVGGQLESDILIVLAHKLLRAYRSDVLTRLQSRIQTDKIPLIQQDQVEFTWDGLQAVFIDPMHAVSGSKINAATPKELFIWLWTNATSHERNGKVYELKRMHWDDLAYRKSLRIDQDKLNALDSSGKLVKRFQKVLYQEFFKYHWAIPYPSPGGSFVSVTKKTLRQIWNVGQKYRDPLEFFWAKTVAQRAAFPKYPAICFFPEQVLHRHFQAGLDAGEDEKSNAS